MAPNIKKVLLLRPQDVRDVIDIGTAIDLVEQGYLEATKNPIINAPRRRVHSKGNVRISNFPGGVDGLNVIGSMTRGELVSHERENQDYPQREHPVFLLWDAKAGTLDSIIIGEITEKRIGPSSIMALRTAATTGVGFRHLVRKNATTAGVFGSGGQALHKILALDNERDIHTYKVFSRSKKNREALHRHLTKAVEIAKLPPEQQKDLLQKMSGMGPEQAREMIDLAARNKRILQVGHLERFNAAILAAEPYLHSPRFVECVRLAPYRERGTDVNVVLDLMIHDIDIVQTIVGAPITSIDAIGTLVFSDEIDIANARIHFASGCVANVTASRVSVRAERKLRIFEDDAYLSLDLQQKILTLIRKRPPSDPPGPLPVTIDEQNLGQGDALKAEIESFLECIRTGRPPVVSGEAGLMALETAMRITEQVMQTLAARKTHA